MSREIVKLEDVWACYNGVPVLESIDLSILSDDFLGIIGPNGGGKTTLLKVILGLIKPVRGRVLISGRPPQKSRRMLGYVPQHSAFDHDFPISVREVVLMGRYGKVHLLRRYGREDRDAVHDALRTVGMLEHIDRQIGTLSGGEQQRVLIARALVSEPAVLLLDEPTASVDTVTQTDFYEMLQGLKKHMAIVLVSHDMSAVSVYVDKIACLNRKLYYHGMKEISTEVLEATYQCPVQIIAHGTVSHRVLKEHQE